MMAVLLAHLNAIAFSAGFLLLAYGLSRWSVPAAFVTCGLILMFLAAWPDRQSKVKSS